MLVQSWDEDKVEKATQESISHLLSMQAVLGEGKALAYMLDIQDLAILLEQARGKTEDLYYKLSQGYDISMSNELSEMNSDIEMTINNCFPLVSNAYKSA